LSLAAASPASVRTVGLKWYAALLCGQAGIELRAGAFPVHISLRRFAQFLRGFRAGDDFVVVLWRLSAIQRRSVAAEVFKPFLAEFGVAGGVLDRAVPEPIPNCPRVMPFVG
jgi:hypothetical protein